MPIDDLSEKYEALLALRKEREALEARGVFALEGEAGRTRKARCRALAGRFPGALRELESLDADAICRRLERARAAHENGNAPPFERMLRRYHELGRLLRALKRWQGQAKQRGPTSLHAARRAVPGLDVLDERTLQDWMAPPNGRAQDALWRSLAREWQSTPTHLKNAVLSAGAEDTITDPLD